MDNKTEIIYMIVWGIIPESMIPYDDDKLQCIKV